MKFKLAIFIEAKDKFNFSGHDHFRVIWVSDLFEIWRWPQNLPRSFDRWSFIDGDFRYHYNCEHMLRRIASLGVPWHKGKGDDHFTSITTFIGYLWDIPRKLVSLTEGKRLKFQEHVRRFLNDFCDGPRPCNLLDVQKIHGSLCHIAFVYTNGRSCLSVPFLTLPPSSIAINSRRFIFPVTLWLLISAGDSVPYPLLALCSHFVLDRILTCMLTLQLRGVSA